MVFTQGFLFSGEVDNIELENSYLTITNNINKFSINNKENEDQVNRLFKVFHVKSTTEKIKNLSSNCFTLMQESEKQVPIGLIVAIDETAKNFSLILIADHSFIDAQSANHILNLIIQHYNAIKSHNLGLAIELIHSSQSLKTYNANDFLNTFTESAIPENHEQNLEKIVNYKIEPDSAPLISDEIFSNYSNSRQVAENTALDLHKYFKRFRDNIAYKHITKNNIITALLAKSFNAVEPDTVKQNSGYITFAMAVSVPSYEQRKQCLGNYVITIPITVNILENTVIEIAQSIQTRIEDCKSRKEDLSRFIITEEYFSQTIQAIEDPFAFYVTNWTNQQLKTNELKLNGCEYHEQIGVLNVKPISKVEASYVNKQGIVICISPNDIVNLSLTPSITNKKPLESILSSVEKLVL